MDNPILIGGICFLIALLLLLSSVPIAVGLGIAALIGFYTIQGSAGLMYFLPFKTTNSFILTAIPLFIFMGEVLMRTGLSERLYSGASRWLAWAPGGLLHSNIGSCTLFAAISGSSPVTAATIGTVAIPALEKRGYDTRLTLGSLAAGGTLGILIPPSISLIVYGALAETSVGRLFAGGIMPGIMLSVMFMAYIATVVMRNPSLAPKREHFSIKGLIISFKELWPIFLIMTIILGGIFGGVVTPTEAAALGAVSALIMALTLRQLNWNKLVDSLKATLETTSMILIIVVGASMLASFLAVVGLPRALTAVVIEFGLPKMIILLLIFLLYLFLGCFMDGVSAMVMTLPTVLPVLKVLGIDLIWFGVVLTVLIEIGMLTPPVGMNVFVIQGISGKSLTEVLRGSMPFFFILLLGLAIMTFFPIIVLWFPSIIMV
jgi:tripartite ATP-independent transporter DctM subunit